MLVTIFKQSSYKTIPKIVHRLKTKKQKTLLYVMCVYTVYQCI